jgi:hypothetical protein
MRVTYSPTDKLDEYYRKGKYREKTQRYLVVRALLESSRPLSLDELFEKLNKPPYWDTVRHKDRTGKPSHDSWLVQKAGGIRDSIKYHLDALEKGGLIK